MGLKHHTIIFVPHSRARFRKWRISNRQVKLASALVALFTLGALFVTWRAFTTTVTLEEVGDLRSENEQLREMNREFEQSFRELQSQLSDFEDRTNSLAILAGVEEIVSTVDSRAGAGVGGAFIDPPASYLDVESLARRSERLQSQLADVAGGLEKREQWIASRPAIMPTRGILTSNFGIRADPITARRAFHHGVDISARPGTPVFATADGVVLRAGRIGSLGRAVYLSHRFGVTTRYGHLSKIEVEPGATVKRGDVIGYVGNSGRATGYHLHYEVREAGDSKDPRMFMVDR
ncbi:MAG: M23 family peptidase [Acidobacteria bacterium]|nr:MAG: M23 family peptidase [Acidobacteriota bacterium]REK00271.1 MAG: M23 family peptidase [Acidobacteriota bacterium]